MKAIKAIGSVTVLVGLLLLAGCRTAPVGRFLVGSWECSDLSPIEHRRTDDRSFIMILGHDGFCTSYARSVAGEVRDLTVQRYRLEGDKLFLCGAGGSTFSFTQAPGSLYLRYIDDHSSTPQGEPLVFHRTKAEQSAVGPSPAVSK